MTTSKFKRKARRIWKKSAKRLGFNILKKIAVIILLIGLNIYGFSAIGGTFGYFNDTETTSVTMTAGIWGTPTPSPTPSPSGVVLNEFLPRPHDDSGIKPDGEWVELYNLSTKSIDLAGYYLKDKLDPASGPSHKIYIENCRTNTGGTIIGPNGFLVVYAKGEKGEEGDSCNSHGFELNNAGDTVRLFNDEGEMIDYYSYDGSVYCSLTPTPGNPNENDLSGSCPGVVPKNKSFARVPDGTGPWYDPIPTPGGPNVLEEEQEPIVDIQNENQNASLSFSETLGAVAGAITEFVLGEEETAASASGFGELTAGTETIVDVPDLTPVASGSGEPPLDSPAGDLTGQALPETSPEVSPSPEASPEPLVIPEPAVTPAPSTSPSVVSPSGPNGSGQATETPQPQADSTGSPQAGDGNLIQTVTEPAIPAEPVTIEQPTEPALPVDPPAPEPAPAPEAPAVPAE